MAKSRGESTKDLTALAFSWLFMRRRCRMMAGEVGIGGKANSLIANGHWRADVVGCAKMGNLYRFDLVEIKGSRADARREDMASGKWELLPQGQMFNGWLLVAHDVRPEDYAGLPPAWGVIQASEEADTARIIRRPTHGEILLSAQQAASNLYILGYRTLNSRIPFLGPSMATATARFHEEAEEAQKQIQLDEARTYPFSAVVEGRVSEGVVPIRGLDGKTIGFGALRQVGEDRWHLVGSIDYASEERLLLETLQASAQVIKEGVSIAWAKAES